MSNKLFELGGKVALITGAFKGLGLDFAHILGEAGATVVLAGRRMEQGKACAETLIQDGIRASIVSMNVEDRSSVIAAFDQITAQLGAPDIVVNNAGVTMTKPLLDLTDTDWESVIDVNLNGAWRVAQAAAQAMKSAGKPGSIINISSILGLRVAKQLPAYAASKAALLHLTQAMALELAHHNIRVNALAPGYIETPLNRDFLATEAGSSLIKRIPQRRLGRSEELAGPLLLLASEASSYMTGAVIVVDGGHTINTL